MAGGLLSRADLETFWLLGNPVAHSLSPLIQNTALGFLGRRAVYLAARVESQGLESAVRGLAALGARGGNVTVPYKEEAFQLCDSLSDRAWAIGATNVLSFRDGKVHGDNTDGTGWLRGLASELGLEPSDRGAVILGSGGSARAVAVTLMEAGCSDLVLLNRTVERAEALARDLGEAFEAAPPVRVDTLASFADHLHEGVLVVQTTSVGLDGSGYPVPPPQFWPREAVLSELVYGRVTPLMGVISDLGGTVQDGLAMLCCQAAESLSLWLDRPLDEIPLELMLTTARQHLASKG